MTFRRILACCAASTNVAVVEGSSVATSTTIAAASDILAVSTRDMVSATLGLLFHQRGGGGNYGGGGGQGGGANWGGQGGGGNYGGGGGQGGGANWGGQGGGQGGGGGGNYGGGQRGGGGNWGGGGQGGGGGGQGGGANWGGQGGGGGGNYGGGGGQGGGANWGGGGGQGGGGQNSGWGSNQEVANSQRAVADSMSPGGDAVFDVEPAAESARKLTDLKKQSKLGKTRKERATAKMAARGILHKARMDSSTDEKTVLTLLNAAAYFKAPTSFTVVNDALSWVRTNVKNLDARNLANVCYALGALKHGKKSEVMKSDFLPAISAKMYQMQPVELAMTLQALGRCDLAEGADDVSLIMIDLLCKKGNDLNPSCAATLLSSLSLLGTAHRNPLMVDEALKYVLTPQIQKITTYHSDIATNLGTALATLHYEVPGKVDIWKSLIGRLTTLANATQPNGCARVYEMLACMKDNPHFPSAELGDDCKALIVAMDVRVAYISNYFTIEDAGEMGEAFMRLGHTLSKEASLKLATGLSQCIAFHPRQSVSDVAAVAYTFAFLKTGTPELFRDLLLNTMGVLIPKPPRETDPGYGQPPPPPDFSRLHEALQEERLKSIARNLDHYMRVRIGCEYGMGPKGQGHPCLLKIAERIQEAAPHATSEKHLSCLRAIACFPPNPGRNQQNDKLILNGIIYNLNKQGEGYTATITNPSFLPNLAIDLKDKPPIYPEVAQIKQILGM